jgi:hypothetical protein
MRQMDRFDVWPRRFRCGLDCGYVTDFKTRFSRKSTNQRTSFIRLIIDDSPLPQAPETPIEIGCRGAWPMIPATYPQRP